MSRTIVGVLALIATVAPLPGCATIISGSTGQSNISSTPVGATFTILRNGKEYHTGTTPQSVDLPRHGKYAIRMALEGYEPVEQKMTKGVSGWYIGGNIFLGGVIGWLIVDPITGAMFTLPDVDIKLIPKAKKVSLANPMGQDRLVVLALSDIPVEYRDKLIPISTR